MTADSVTGHFPCFRQSPAVGSQAGQEGNCDLIAGPRRILCSTDRPPVSTRGGRAGERLKDDREGVVLFCRSASRFLGDCYFWHVSSLFLGNWGINCASNLT